MTKSPPRHNDTLWLNRDVQEVVAKRNIKINLNPLKINIISCIQEGDTRSSDDSPRAQVA